MKQGAIHPQIQAHLPEVIALLEKHKVRSAYVFGSVLSESFNADSDVDFLVNLETDLDPVDAGGRLWDLYYGLKDLLHREIDLLTERSLRNPYFIEEVNKTKVSIYG